MYGVWIVPILWIPSIIIHTFQYSQDKDLTPHKQYWQAQITALSEELV